MIDVKKENVCKLIKKLKEEGELEPDSKVYIGDLFFDETDCYVTVKPDIIEQPTSRQILSAWNHLRQHVNNVILKEQRKKLFQEWDIIN